MPNEVKDARSRPHSPPKGPLESPVGNQLSGWVGSSLPLLPRTECRASKHASSTGDRRRNNSLGSGSASRDKRWEAGSAVVPHLWRRSELVEGGGRCQGGGASCGKRLCACSQHTGVWGPVARKITAHCRKNRTHRRHASIAHVHKIGTLKKRCLAAAAEQWHMRSGSSRTYRDIMVGTRFNRTLRASSSTSPPAAIPRTLWLSSNSSLVGKK